MRFVIFGTGKYYSKRREKIFELCEDAEIVCYMDNNAEAGVYFEGKKVFRPGDLKDAGYDKILLMSRSFLEMRDQLSALGYPEEAVWTWDRFVCEMSHGKYEWLCGTCRKQGERESVLIISTDLGYNGGSIAAGYAARALSDRYEVILAAPGGDRRFIRELASDGVNILLCPALPYPGKEEQYWIDKFDMVIVNVFQMLPAACRVSRWKPALWWIHEPGDMYQEILALYPSSAKGVAGSKINIKAVSKPAKKNFDSHFPDRIQGLLPYGIPDELAGDSGSKEKNTYVFAVIGAVIYKKAQDIFIKAASLIHENPQMKTDVEYWIIGDAPEDGYSSQVFALSEENSRIKIKGKMTRAEMKRAYQEIDAVVCPSREDSLPIVMTEGMMYGKVCIASDATGTADYIRDGENGLICGAGSVESLAERMRWVIEHPDRRSAIGENARRTYEEYFAMDKFGGRLEAAIRETQEMYGGA